MDYSKYTERQLAILNGAISLEYVAEVELRRIYAKALYSIDLKSLEFAEMELKRRNKRVPDCLPYSENHLKLINDESARKVATDQAMAALYSKAQRLGDREVAAMALGELKHRKNWVPPIPGYSAYQVALVIGMRDIETVHDNAIRGLRKAAIANGDLDIVELAENEFERRSLTYFTDEKIWLDTLQKNLELGWHDRMTETELIYAAHHASRSNDTDLLSTINKEIRRRSINARGQDYSDVEEDIIKGRISLEEASLWQLNQLKSKLILDDSQDFSKLMKALDRECDKKIAEIRAKKSWRDEYTERQKYIMDGTIPLYEVKTPELETLLRKTERRDKGENTAFIEEELKARKEKLEAGQPYDDIQKMIINTITQPNVKTKRVSAQDVEAFSKKTVPPKETEKASPLRETVKGYRDDEYNEALRTYSERRPYSKRQEDILGGFIPLSRVERSEISSIVKRATKIGDNDNLALAKAYLVQKDAQIQEAAASVNAKSVARGEIPYEAITIRQLNSLSAQAKKNGDIELYELINTLIIEKQADRAEKGKKERNPFVSYVYDDSYTRPYQINEKDVNWAMEILESRITPEPLSIMDLQDIRLYADTLDDPAYGRVARMLIDEKLNPSSVYVVQTREEACALIELHTMYPIRWPEQWFSE